MSQDDSSLLTRDIAPFGVRMPPDLKERVAAAAKANSRSMNAEIVATLEEKYPVPISESLIEDAVKILEKFIETSPAEFRDATERMLKRLKSGNRSVAEHQALVALRTFAQIGAESIGAPPPPPTTDRS